METLAPSLRLAQHVRYAIESGDSVRQGLRDYLALPADSFTRDVVAWMHLVDRGCSTKEFLQKMKSPARRHLLSLIERGLAGEPLLAALSAMDEELQEQSLLQIEGFLGQLPFRMLLPLLFFIFPAFVTLLLGPLLLKIVEGMGS